MSPLVVSLNPAVDVEWRVPRILPEEKNELISERRWPGGKGVNVARWLRWLECPAHLFLPLGGSTGEELADGLRREGIEFSSFPLKQPSRVNVVVTPDPGAGSQFRFNPTWPRVSPAETRGLLRGVAERTAQANPVIISGTLAFGASIDTYARMARAAKRLGKRVVLDCDRQPFALAVKEGPWLVKPNEFELGQWSRMTLRTRSAQWKAARSLAEATGGWVLLSRGGEGAWLLNAVERVAWSAVPKAVTVRNRVGAGDAMLAGAVAASAKSDQPEDWLRSAVATGTAATQVAPGAVPSRSLWRRIRASVELSVIPYR
jgi:6-phosphofructokinase 2